MNERRRILGKLPLPYDAEISYLQSSGNQYIDTGIYITQYPIKVETKAYFSSSGSNSEQDIFGNYNGTDSKKCIIVGKYDTKFHVWTGSRWQPVAYSTDKYYTLSFEAKTSNSLEIIIDNTKYTSTNSTSATQSNSSIYLFCTGSGKTSYLTGRICYVKIYSNNVLVRDMIPVRIGQVGYMYDKVSKTLFGNAGTGSFTLGPDIDAGTYYFEYTGSVESVTLQPGKYKLECWGAQGGSYDTTYYGGKGGYSTGIVTIGTPTTIYVYAGGQGAGGSSSGSKTAGFNGGGAGYATSTTYLSGSGGGASDIRIGQDSLYARVIVAGGGGGFGSYNSTNSNRRVGGYGGGTSGGTGGQYSTSYKAGTGGTQTAKGTSYYQTTADSTTYGNLPAFGTGGSSKNTSYQIAGGGGGWYGGGYASRGGGAGGGSGYVYTSDTASNYPSGCLLSSSYYLKNAETKAGNTSFTSPTGTNETGHTGNGCVKITKLDIKPGTISYDETTVDKTYTDGSFVNPLNLTGNGTVTYSSSDITVATVYSNGTVAIKKVGTCTITATVSDTDKFYYDVNTASYTLNIAKGMISPTVTLADWGYGSTAKSPTVTGNVGYGTVTYYYKVRGADDSTYTTTKPSDMGHYTVRAVIGETTNTYGGEATDDFSITATSPSARTGLSYNGSTQYLTTEGMTQHGTFYYSYDGTTWQTTRCQQTTPGTYTTYWKLEATDGWDSIPSTAVTTTISKASRTLSFSESDVYVETGGTVTKTATVSAGSGTVYYSIANTTYATINSSTGKVTAKSNEGSVTVYAEIASDSYYLSASASYTLYVYAAVRDFSYTGSAQSLTLVPGTYQLQCWGAQGGSNASDSSYGITSQAGGKGGYSTGQLTLSQATAVQVYVGGAGSSSSGGWNGGGNTTGSSTYDSGGEYGTSRMGGGGGATDIRLSDGNLLSRMIVAGGGSGGAMGYKAATTTTTTTKSIWPNASGFSDYGINDVTGEVNTTSIPIYRQHSDYIDIGNFVKITYDTFREVVAGGYIKIEFYWYNSSKSYISATPWYTSTGEITPPSNARYVRIVAAPNPDNAFQVNINNRLDSSINLTLYYTETSTSTSTNSNVGYVGGGTTGGGTSSYRGTQSSAGSNGSFGAGANQSSSNYRYCSGAGGGGWYGGGSHYSDSSMNSVEDSGGGSGWVNTYASRNNRPSGYTGLQLDSGTTYDGEQSFPATSGGNETGHSGNGYARITKIS